MMTSTFRYTLPVTILLLLAAAAVGQPADEQAVSESQDVTSTKEGESYVYPPVEAEVAVEFYGFQDRPDLLRDAVSRAFDARQAAQRAEVERLRRELAEIEIAIRERERHRTRIIEGRVRELLQSDQARQLPAQDDRGDEIPGLTIHAPGVHVQYGFGRDGTPQVVRPEHSNPKVAVLTFQLAEIDVDQQKLKRLIELAREESEVTQRAREAIQARFTHGDAADQDVDQARLHELRAKETLVQREAELGQLRIRWQKLSHERDRLLEYGAP